MNKKSIKSVYHWSIMLLIMGAPLIYNTIGCFPNTYGQSDVVSYQKEEFKAITNENEFEVGGEYYFDFSSAPNDNDYLFSAIEFNDKIFKYTSVEEGVEYSDGIYNSIDYPNWSLVFSGNLYLGCSGYIGLELTEFDYPEDMFYLLAIGNFGRYENVDVYVIDNPCYQVWKWSKDFTALPINNWYDNLLDITIGRMAEQYNSMEFLKAYPLYALWVLILDLMFDCLAVIPRLCHGLLEKIGGDKE